MRKLLKVTLIIVVFFIAFAIVHPSTYGLDYEQSNEEFAEAYIEPTMTITIDYFSPFLKSNNKATFKLRFAPMTPVTKVQEDLDTSHQVVDYTGEAPASYLLDYNEMDSLQRYDHYADGSIEKTPIDKTKLEESEEGSRYEGWFPSPNQLAEFIAWSNGWQLNYVDSCERNYEANSEKERVDIIYEQELADISVSTDFEEMEDGIEQEVTQVKGMNKLLMNPKFRDQMKAVNPTWEPETTDLSIYGSIECLDRGNDTTKLFWFAIIAILLIVLVGTLLIEPICSAIIATDATPFGVDDLADAYQEGFELGVNETTDNYQSRLDKLLIDGDISNETYSLLQNELDDNWDQTMSEFNNPYEDLEIGGGNSWFHTIITVIKAIIVITIIIIVVIIVLYLLRRAGIIMKKKTATGAPTLQLKIDSAKSISEEIQSLFLGGLCIGNLI